MIFQTLTKKDKKTDLEEIKVSLENVMEKHCEGQVTIRPTERELLIIYDFPNRGGIVTGLSEERNLDYCGIICNGYIEYLGFRNTKKFEKMIIEIKKAFEGICYVHTGERKELKIFEYLPSWAPDIVNRAYANNR